MNKYSKCIGIFGVLIIVGLLALLGTRSWMAYKEGLRVEGYERAVQEISRQRVLNERLRYEMQQRIDQGVQQGIDAYTQRFEQEQSERQANEQVTRDNIETMIAANPDFYTNRLCNIPNAMLVERNRIRSQIQ